MSWSEWKNFCDINFKDIPQTAGIYYIRCTGKAKNPIKIPRVGGIDKEGIIYIGESGKNLMKRIKSFWFSAKNKNTNTHVAGVNYKYWGYSKKFPLKSLQICYRTYRNETRSKKTEADCLWEYRKEKGLIELPPLNFSAGRT